MNRKTRALSPSPFRRFNASPAAIRVVVMMYVRFPLSLRNVEDLLLECGIDIRHKTGQRTIVPFESVRMAAGERPHFFAIVGERQQPKEVNARAI